MARETGGRNGRNGRIALHVLAAWFAFLGLGPGPAFPQGHGGPDLGPNPGHIPMSPRLQRRIEEFFGVAPSRPVPVRRAAPPARNESRAARASTREQGRRADLVALGLTPEALAALRAARFTVLAERPGGLARLGGPPGVAEDEALERLRGIAPDATADANHRFRLAATEGRAAPATPARDTGGACDPARPPLVAIVDTGVAAGRNDALAGAIELRETLRGPGRRPAPTTHGTAVALRLVSALPDARLAVLDVFHRDPEGEAADAFDLAAALTRTADIGAAIANISVVGPANAVVYRAGADATMRGVLFVAAAGNDGPEAAPLYPAAHLWAVAVTAVDAEGVAWNRAATGPHIAFAAPGIDVPLPERAGERERTLSGTSLATPVVTAMLAVAGPAVDPAARVERLARRARDAGEPGRDSVYGYGVVELDACVLRREPHRAGR